MKKITLVSAAILLFLLIQIWFLFLTFRYPHTGILIEKDTQNQWVITAFEESASSSRVGLEMGDRVVSVNNKPTEEHFSVKKWRTIDQADRMVIERSGVITEVTMERTRSFIDYMSLTAEFVCFSISAAILLTMRSSRSAIYLAVVFLTIGLIFMSLLASIRGDYLGKVIINTSMMVLPVVFYHFLHVFFLEKGHVRSSKKFLHTLYGVVLVTFFLRLILFSASDAYPYYAYSNTITIVVFLLGMGLNFYSLTSMLIRHWRTNEAVSQLIKAVWLSIIISFFPFSFLSFLPILLFKQPWVSTFHTGIVILFFPLSFTYLIATKQLFEIHIVLRRLSMTTVIALVPSLLITALDMSIYHNETTLAHAFTLFCVVLFIISIVLYALEYFSTKLERIMFPRKHVLQSALKKISKRLGTITSFRELKETILVDIVTALQLHGGAIVFRYKEEHEVFGVGQIDLAEVEKLVREKHEEHPEYLIYELNSNEEYTGYLIITRKKTNTLLGMEDLQWLNLIISYLSVSIENIFLIRKLTMKLEHLAAQMPSEQDAKDLTWFRKLMFELQEKERIRMANDIHDTTMQDLFFLKRRLHSVLSRSIQAEEDRQQMTGLIDYLEVINTNLRQSCFELHPHLLREIGLLQTLHKLIEQERAASPFEIELFTEHAEAAEQFNLDSRRHIFRITQELLNNAKKHSSANKVIIQLYCVGGLFYLSYEDDGIGFEPLFAGNDTNLSGIGMEQMRSRILTMNGKLELISGVGSGVKITIELPMQEGMDT